MSNAGKTFPVEVLTGSEVLSLVNACSLRASTGVRNRALIVMLWRTGLRISECLSLKPKDIDRSDNSIRVLRGKGKKARLVAMDEQGFLYLDNWLKVRQQFSHAHSTVFCTLKGGQLNSDYLRQLLPRLAAKVGIQKRVHPHCFRHTFSYEICKENMPINLIQQTLGHANLNTTQKYVSHVAAADVVAALKARTW